MELYLRLLGVDREIFLHLPGPWICVPLNALSVANYRGGGGGLKLTTDLNVVSELIMRRVSYPGSSVRRHGVAFNKFKVCYLVTQVFFFYVMYMKVTSHKDHQ